MNTCIILYVQALLNISEDIAMEVVMDSCDSGEKCERELTKSVNKELAIYRCQVKYKNRVYTCIG